MTLSAGILALSPLAAAAAAGRAESVAEAARLAVAAGATADDVRETLLTAVPFCGFPRALDAFAAARDVLKGARISADGAASPSRGAAFFDRVYGADAERVRRNLGLLDADVARWIEAHAYGQVLSRPGLPPHVRELVGVVLLAVQGLRAQLSGHVRGALNCGATAGDVTALVDAASDYIAPDTLAFVRETIARVAP